MTRSVALAIAALAILALPAPALAADTRIDRKHEHVGLLVPTGPSTWTVQDLDYHRIATVQRSSAARFDFLRDGRAAGSVRRATASVWRVFRGETLLGEVRRVNRRTWKAYLKADGDPYGLAEGRDPIPAAASVLFAFRGQTGVARHDHGTHRH